MLEAMAYHLEKIGHTRMHSAQRGCPLPAGKECRRVFRHSKGRGHLARIVGMRNGPPAREGDTAPHR